MVTYEKALRMWGRKRLLETQRVTWAPRGLKLREDLDFDEGTVTVNFVSDEGNPCCEGYDPDCYCSPAEPPRAKVQITGVGSDGFLYSSTISADEFDFAKVLGEIVAAAGGVVTAGTEAES